MNYDGTSRQLKNLDGRGIKVKAGQRVFNEFNPVAVEKEPVYSTIDYTTPVPATPIKQYAGKQPSKRIVRLDNGWFVLCSLVSSTKLQVYLSNDYFETAPEPIYELTLYSRPIHDFALETDGTDIYIVYTMGDTSANFVHLNVKGKVIKSNTIGTAENYLAFVDLLYVGGGNFHCTFTARVNGYSNCSNLFYTASNDVGNTWGTPINITKQTSSAYQHESPVLTTNDQGAPVILVFGGYYRRDVNVYIRNGETWTSYGALKVNTDAHQYKRDLSVAKLSNGNIVVTWAGYTDLAPSHYNIWFCESSGGAGTLWGVPQVISQNTQQPKYSSMVAVDSNDVVYLVYNNPSAGMQTIIKKRIGGEWTDEIIIRQETAPGDSYPSIIKNYKDFIEPLIIFRDRPSNKSHLYGKWEDMVVEKQVIPPLSTLTESSQAIAQIDGKLMMWRPNDNARFQGFVTKKDEFNHCWGEEQSLGAVVGLGASPFGVRGALKPYFVKRIVTGKIGQGLTGINSCTTKLMYGFSMSATPLQVYVKMKTVVSFGWGSWIRQIPAPQEMSMGEYENRSFSGSMDFSGYDPPNFNYYGKIEGFDETGVTITIYARGGWSFKYGYDNQVSNITFEVTVLGI